MIERTFNAGENFPRDTRKNAPQMQYLYKEGKLYVSWIRELQPDLSEQRTTGDSLRFLKDNKNIYELSTRGRPLARNCPTVELELIETEPGNKGDTATAPAKRQVDERRVVQVRCSSTSAMCVD